MGAPGVQVLSTQVSLANRFDLLLKPNRVFWVSVEPVRTAVGL